MHKGITLIRRDNVTRIWQTNNPKVDMYVKLLKTQPRKRAKWKLGGKLSSLACMFKNLLGYAITDRKNAEGILNNYVCYKP